MMPTDERESQAREPETCGEAVKIAKLILCARRGYRACGSIRYCPELMDKAAHRIWEAHNGKEGE